MDPCADLIEKLKRHPELVWCEIPGGVRVEAPSPSGFAIELVSDIHGWEARLGNAGFHDDFVSADEAANFVAWCYSGTARVREVWRGNSPQAAILEACEDGEWRRVSGTWFIFVPFWRKRSEVILQNPDLLRAP